jgi:hypothetical protein
VHTRPEDSEAAARQTDYVNLSGEEKILQDKWAKTTATDLAPCPADLLWVRHESYPGYCCTAGMHFVSDLMIAEGIPGVYTYREPPWPVRRRMPMSSSQNVPEGMCGVVERERWNDKELDLPALVLGPSSLASQAGDVVWRDAHDVLAGWWEDSCNRTRHGAWIRSGMVSRM